MSQHNKPSVVDDNVNSNYNRGVSYAADRKRYIEEHRAYYAWCLKNIDSFTIIDKSCDSHTLGHGQFARRVNSYYQFIWIKDGKTGSDDGKPSFVSVSSCEWAMNGYLHRVEGPASISKGKILWYFLGNRINVKSQKKFEKWIMENIG